MRHVVVCVIAMQANAAVPVMLDLMEALVASLQQMGRLQDRPCKFTVTGSAGTLQHCHSMLLRWRILENLA